MIQCARQHGAHADIGAGDPAIENIWCNRLQDVDPPGQCRFRRGGAQLRFEWAVTEKHEVRCGKTWILDREEELFEPTMGGESAVVQDHLRVGAETDGGTQLRAARFGVYAAQEAFYTSASAFVMPVVEIDGRAIGEGRPGALTRRLRELYIEAARQG